MKPRIANSLSNQFNTSKINYTEQHKYLIFKGFGDFWQNIFIHGSHIKALGPHIIVTQNDIIKDGFRWKLWVWLYDGNLSALYKYSLQVAGWNSYSTALFFQIWQTFIFYISNWKVKLNSSNIFFVCGKCNNCNIQDNALNVFVQVSKNITKTHISYFPANGLY